MKILLFGASGLLGSAVARSAKRRRHQVVGIVGKYSDPVPDLDRQVSVNCLELPAVESFVLESFPDAIVNCAATSEPKDCLANPERSRNLNVLFPEKLALLSRHLFARFVHISSEQVFDGVRPPYHDDSPTRPTNLYAEQKLEAEERVNSLAAEFATILRMPLLNGNSLNGDRSFHERLFHAWANGQQTNLFTDEIRQPCLVDNAADAIVEILERDDIRGIFNWAGSEKLSRYEMGLRLLKKFGLPTELAFAATRGDNPKFAHRQPELSFDLRNLSGKMKTQPMDYEQQLDALIVPKPVRAWYNAV